MDASESMLKDSMRKRWSCLRVVEIANSQSQMEQYQGLTTSTLIQINLFEERVAKIFLMNRKGLHQRTFKTHIRMPVKHEMISGPSPETSHTAITMNQESNSTRRGENHFPSHSNILTSPESLILRWRYCRNVVSMIFGTSMDQEICPVHGQVSHSTKSSGRMRVVRGGTENTARNIQI